MSKEKASALISKLTGKGFVEADAALFENATDEQFARLESLIPAEVAAPAVATEVKTETVAEPVAAAAKTPTFEEVLATASPEVKESIAEGLRVSAAKRESTIAVLKASNRCEYSDAQLKAMSQADLDKLVKLANVKAATDFSAQAPKVEGEQPAAPASQSLTDVVKAARAAKK